MNNWKNIWNQRTAQKEILESHDPEQIFLELKRSNGFDIVKENGITYQAFYGQYQDMLYDLSHDQDRELPIQSVYEVGCGSGANLYLMEQDCIRCGGLDFSASLIKSAKRILQTSDLTCDEAIHLPLHPKYDALLSLSVFSYFEDEKYAKEVLEKMYQKATFSIGILDVHDISKKEDFLAYRKKEFEDYEERYQNLPKLFYAREFFEEFARTHGMDILFTESKVKNYWNNDFIFNCYMYIQ